MIFRYPGGKSRKSIRDKILSCFPKNVGEYRDIMVGGGGIFFHIHPNIKRTINDLDTGLVSVYLALRDRTQEFIEKCRAILPQNNSELLASAKNGKKLYSARLKDVFDKFKNNEQMDQALRWFFINRTVWSGRVNYKLDSRMYFSNPSGWNIVNTNKLKQAAILLQNVDITNNDYKELLFKDGKDVLIYIDPPYYKNTMLSKTSRLYCHNFELKDHIELSECIKNCKHKIILSYDDESYIKSLYDGFNIYQEGWVYSGTSSASEVPVKTKRVGKELIITNF